MTRTIPAPAALDGPQTTAEAVVDAARHLAARMTLTPKWRDRLTPDAVALVDAVLEHDRAGATT